MVRLVLEEDTVGSGRFGAELGLVVGVGVERGEVGRGASGRLVHVVHDGVGGLVQNVGRFAAAFCAMENEGQNLEKKIFKIISF